MIDFAALNRAIADRLPSLFPAAARHGHELAMGDVTGREGGSLKIHPGKMVWQDFGTGEKGDLVDLLAAHWQCGKADVAERLGMLPPPDAMPAPAAAKRGRPPKAPFVPIYPPPPDTPAPEAPLWKGVAPAALWTYRDAAGALLMRVARWNLPGGKKQILPQCWGTVDGVTGWHLRHLPDGRPLYGLDRLARFPADAPVVIVEGEKTADAAQRLIPTRPVLTWSAGTGGLEQTDWSPLAGRRCILIPDRDAAGIKAMRALAERLTVAKLVDPGAEGDGWDLADAAAAGWTAERVKAWVLERPDLPAPAPVAPKAPPRLVRPDDPAPEPRDDAPPGAPVPLGYDHGVYYYLSQANGQVHALTAAEHTRGNLRGLASVSQYWERTIWQGRRGVDWEAAADAMIDACTQVGIYDPSRIRTVGAAWDQGRAVVHLGDRLMVDGDIVHPPTGQRFLTLPESRAVYELARAVELDPAEPLSDEEGRGIVRLFQALSWEDPDMAYLAAGWTAVAPICGALDWRTHAWLQGPKGVGKSTVIHEIMRPLIGSLALSIDGKTSEAGIRQTLKSSARPVLYDEAETQNRQDRERLQLVLDLARGASSPNGATIIKGGKDGEAQRFFIRSSFLFSSINLGLTQAADESRFIVLRLARRDNAPADHWEGLKRAIFERITTDISGRLLARMVSLLPTIRANAAMLAQAVGERYADRRLGDTLGSVLAGLVALSSRRRLSIEDAREFVASRAWVGQAAERAAADVEADHARALAHLLQSQIRVTPAKERPISELLGAWRSDAESARALRESGVKIEGDHIWLARGHVRLNAIFASTPWASSWPSILLQAPGSTIYRRDGRSSTTYFTPHIKARALGLRLNEIGAFFDLSGGSDQAAAPPDDDPPFV